MNAARKFVDVAATSKSEAVRSYLERRGIKTADYGAGSRYASKKRPAILYNPRSSGDGENHLRWVENPKDGLRLVGYVDEIKLDGEWRNAIDHKGWFLEDDGLSGDVARGVVFRLPCHKGEPRFAYGIEDPFNGASAALLSFDSCGSLDDARRYADGFAERYAERERDYRRADGKRQEFNAMGEELETLKPEIAELRKELRNARKLTPAIAETARRALKAMLARKEKLESKRAELEAEWSTQDGWNA